MFVFATVRFMEIPCFDTEYRETACLENGNYRVSVMLSTFKEAKTYEHRLT